MVLADSGFLFGIVNSVCNITTKGIHPSHMTRSIRSIVIGASPRLTAEIFGPGDTMASVVVNQFGEASGTQRAGLIGLGVILLGLTILIGMAARVIVARADRRLGLAT